MYLGHGAKRFFTAGTGLGSFTGGPWFQATLLRVVHEVAVLFPVQW
jgi:hypothetical protein